MASRSPLARAVYRLMRSMERRLVALGGAAPSAPGSEPLAGPGQRWVCTGPTCVRGGEVFDLPGPQPGCQYRRIMCPGCGADMTFMGESP